MSAMHYPLFSVEKHHKDEMFSDDDDEDEEEEVIEETPRHNDQQPSKISCYLATVDRELYGRCESDGE